MSLLKQSLQIISNVFRYGQSEKNSLKCKTLKFTENFVFLMKHFELFSQPPSVNVSVHTFFQNDDTERFECKDVCKCYRH